MRLSWLSLLSSAAIAAQGFASHQERPVLFPLRGSSGEVELAAVRGLDSNKDGTADGREALEVALRVGGASESIVSGWLSSVLGSSASANETDLWEPWQRHLGVANDSASVMVTWVTVSPYKSPGGASVLVAAADASGNCPPSTPTWTSIPASSGNYSVPARWWDPTGSGGVWVHRATVPFASLSGSSQFCYATGGVSPLTSQWYGGDGPPLVGQTPQPPNSTNTLQVALFADQGTVALLGFAVEALAISEAGWDDDQHYAASVVAAVRGEPVERVSAGSVGPSDAVVVVGDVSYAGIATNIKILNITSNDEWEPIWDVYGQMVEPMASKRVFVATRGNHDYFYEGVALQHRYPMPSAPIVPVDPPEMRWFSWVQGPVRFISISSEDPYDKGSPQWMWISSTLATAQRQRTSIPWVVLLVHRPMLSSDADEYSAHCPGAPLDVALNPLFQLYQAPDMVVSGHQHAFEVSHPTVNGSVVTFPTNITVPGGSTEPAYIRPAAPVHVMMGAAGAIQEEQWIEPQPVWSFYREANTLDSYGYGILNIYNSTHARYNFRPLTGIPGLSFWIIH